MFTYIIALCLLYRITKPYKRQITNWFRQNNIIDILNRTKPLTAVMIGIPVMAVTYVAWLGLCAVADLIILGIIFGFAVVCGACVIIAAEIDKLVG